MENKIKRTDIPNKTVEELMRDGWVWIGAEYNNLIRGFLMMVRTELDREYWNANQTEMVSPFENNGVADFVTDYVTIRSYNWEENILPNLDTDELKIFWYKHANRGVDVLVKNKENIGEMLARVLNNTVDSIHETFEKEED